jgi:hypothetical protein
MERGSWLNKPADELMEVFEWPALVGRFVDFDDMKLAKATL